MLSPSAARALRKAGYHERRWVDAAAFDAALASHGFVLTPEARRLLERVGGLQLSMPHPAHQGVTIHVHFDAERAASSVFKEQIDILAARAGVPLCPIGAALGGVLLVDSTGAVYAALDDWFVTLGTTLDEALDELTAGGSGRPVP